MDLLSLGRYLRESREAHERTLEDAEAALKIRRRILESFEAGEFDQPDLSTVQVRGFIRNYARYLSLDGDKIVGYYEAAKLEASQPAKSRQRHEPRPKRRRNKQTVAPVPDPQRQSDEQLVAAKSITDTDPSLPTVPDTYLTLNDEIELRRRRRLNTLNRTVIFLVSAAALSLSALVAYQIVQRPTGAIIVETVPDILLEPSLTPTFTPLPSATSIQQAFAPTQQLPPTQIYSGQGIMVSVLMRQRTWIRVVADGEERFVGVAPPDSTLPVIEALQRVEITASNADALLITYNGQPQRSFGQRGQRIDIVFTATGVEVSSGITFEPTSVATATFVPTADIDVGALIEAQTPTITPGPSLTPTLTQLPTLTPIPSVTPTFTPPPTNTPTITPTEGPSPTATATVTPTITQTPSVTPTSTVVLPPRNTPVNLTPTKDGL